MARFPAQGQAGGSGRAGRVARPRRRSGATSADASIPVPDAEHAVGVSPARKPKHAYHHGNLRQALLDQALVTIGDRGVEALTLREVGAKLRVSRTALYRHFADKTALLAAVATEGFRTFRAALHDGWTRGGHGRTGLQTMGESYVRFALAHPAHYRVMFGGFVSKAACDSQLTVEASGAFRVLLDAIVELQQQGLVRAGDPEALAVFVWSSTHGLAMLAIDGQLSRPGVSIDALTHSMVESVWAAVEM